MSKNKIIIVEDEALIADHIASILENANYEVIGIFDEAQSLFTFLEEQVPDLLILDINLNGDLDGVDIAYEINSKHEIPIIFLTSNTDKRTIERVKRTMPVSFIAKPYTADGLVSNVDIALHKSKELLQNKLKTNSRVEDDAIFVKDKNELVKIMYDNIAYVQAMDNYAIIVVTTGKKYVVPHTLKKLEEDLLPHNFIKTHRSYLVNYRHISSILPKAVKINDIEIPLSEGHKPDVLCKINTL